jgi:membrane protease YdiL (CAAX protease family)
MFKWLHFRRRGIPEFLEVPWGVRDVLWFVLIWLGLQLAFGAALAVLATMWPPAAGFLAAARRGDIGAAFTLNLVSVGMGFGIVAMYLRRYKVGWERLGWRRVGVLRTIKYLFGIMLAFVLLANVMLVLVKLLVPEFNIDQPQSNEFTTAVHTNPSLALVALVLIPPIIEETIFRGFVFPALSKRTGLIWGALISSLLFGVAHGQANLFVYTTVLGLLLCFMYVRLRSIVPGILVHMLNNYLAFVALSGR